MRKTETIITFSVGVDANRRNFQQGVHAFSFRLGTNESITFKGSERREERTPAHHRKASTFNL